MTSADLLSWLLTYAAHSTLLLGLAWLVNRQVQSHAIKDLLWKTALIGGLATASLQRSNLSALNGLGVRVAMPEAVAAASPQADSPVSSNRLKPTTHLPRATQSAGDQPGAVGVSAVDPVTLVTPTPNSKLPTPVVVLGLWSTIALLLVVRFIASRWRMARDFGRRQPVAEGELTMTLAQLRVAAQIRRRIRLTQAAGLSSPLALGVSEICLPEAVLTELEPEQQHSVLAHELAHLARFDPLWLDVAGVLERVFFFQPLNRLARKRIQDGAEYLCDDWAVRRTGSGITLAKCLVKVAEWMEGTPRAVPVSGMAEHRSQLVSRIHRLIGNHAMRTGPRPRWMLPASAVLLVATAAFAPGFTSQNRTSYSPVTADAMTPVIQVSDTDSTVATPAHRERALTELRLAADRDAIRANRFMTSGQLAPLRAELVAKSRAMAAMRVDMRPALASARSGRLFAQLDAERGRQRGDTNSAAVPALLEALKDPEVMVRRAAAQSLTNLDDIRTVPGLIEALRDSDKEVRTSAAQGLGNLHDERAIDGLIGLLKDPDPEVRAAAVEALGELHSQKAIPGLSAAMRDDNKDVRRAAIEALNNMEAPVPVAALIAALKDSDAEVRQAAANGLGRAEDKSAVRPLMAVLSDQVADVRQAAADALGSLQDPQAADALAALLRDSNADVREAAAGSLGNLELKVAPAALLDAMKDANHDVRQRAASTAGNIQDPKAVPMLKALLDDTDADVREASIEALSEIKDRTALDALIGALKSKDANVRKQAAEALGHREE
ncbi:MAG: M56 family metallopeptidase [Gemmatimonadota bacterium]